MSRRCFCWLVVILIGLSPIAARAQGQGLSERNVEATLLHRRVNLNGLQKWNRASKSWQPLAMPRSKLLVVNIWSYSCLPCKLEFPLFRQMVAKLQGHAAVEFLFVADPPDETSAEQIEKFWAAPYVELHPGERCTAGLSVGTNVRPRCQLEVPDVDPARTTDQSQLKSISQVTMRPLTLLVDRTGLVRQVFAGSVAARSTELREAIDRLTGVL